MNHKVLLCVLILLGFSCSQNESLKNVDVTGLWKIELTLEEDKKSIPFFLEIINRDSTLKASVWNGNEQIFHDSIEIIDDTMFIESPFFNTTMALNFDRNNVTGYWRDNSRGDYQIPLSGKYNLSQRFRFQGPLEHGIDGKWQVTFSPDTEESYDAIGLFETDSNSMKGTFITETGDYRFLEGGFAVNELRLSTFDGSHAFLFEAELTKDTLHGWFYSGNHYKEPFKAWRNDSTKLISPYVMTELVDPSQPIDFTFNDLQGNQVSLSDSQYLNKPVLIQIVGSWCPNCMDEFKFLTEQKEFLKDKGIEVVALSFERLDYEQARLPLLKLKNNLGVDYPILYAGTANKSEATKALPWLRKIKSYPTLLFVLPNRTVLKTHTGFYGPGTGKYYIKQSQELRDNLATLSALSQPTPER
jgi:thiol-disulfide isomerase/thioredoxin